MENEELTGTKVPHLKVTGTVTKFPWKSNFSIPVRTMHVTVTTDMIFNTQDNPTMHFY